MNMFPSLATEMPSFSGPRHAPIRISENSVLLWHRYTATLSQGQWTVEASQWVARSQCHFYPAKLGVVT